MTAGSLADTPPRCPDTLITTERARMWRRLYSATVLTWQQYERNATKLTFSFLRSVHLGSDRAASHVDANLFRLWWSRLCQAVPCMLSVCSNPTWTGKIYRKMTFCTSLESQRDCNHWWRSKNLSPKSQHQILRSVGILLLIAISFGL